MESCLGISTENNLIKYAKISKNRDDFTIDSYGVKFGENTDELIGQIIEETESERTSININLTDEIYNEFTVFNGLKPKDAEIALSNEFEMYCDDNNINFKATISKYLLSQDPLEKEKNKALYISANKGEIAGKLEKLKQHKINNLIPLPIALFNLLSNIKENTAIINIEDKTTITCMVNGNIVSVDILEIGMKQILNKIMEKETSIAKAYQACKNTTIFTMETLDTSSAGEYLQDIMPILYEIVTGIKKIFENKFISMQKIYLTGTATIINNLDLYFQEYFTMEKCELLNPQVLFSNTVDINKKDLIEVNSAIALARQGLGEGIQETNFKNIYTAGNLFEEIKRLGKSDVSLESIKAILKRVSAGKEKANKKSKKSLKIDLGFKGKLNNAERVIVHVMAGTVAAMVIYTVISTKITNMINEKISETDEVINKTKTIISSINNDTQRIKTKTEEYTAGIKRLEELTGQVNNEYRYRKSIPNLLNRIMALIPDEVQLTAIQTTSESSVKISAQALKYEELGYFGATLKNNGVLLDTAITSVIRTDDIIKVEIEGSLP